MGEIEKIENKVVTGRARLLASVEGLDGTEWDWQPGDGRWSVRLTIAGERGLTTSPMRTSAVELFVHSLTGPDTEECEWQSMRPGVTWCPVASKPIDTPQVQ